MATKRFSIALLGIFLSVVAFAAGKDLDKDITMVSYEQSWLDDSGTLALKNNSSEEVKNVVFLITYLDMSGNELDYEEFSRRVSIAPGMTKKFDIPAYEHSRHYHYYKTKDEFGNPSFKIKFRLKDYNVEEQDTRKVGIKGLKGVNKKSNSDYEKLYKKFEAEEIKDLHPSSLISLSPEEKAAKIKKKTELRALRELYTPHEIKEIAKDQAPSTVNLSRIAATTSLGKSTYDEGVSAFSLEEQGERALTDRRRQKQSEILQLIIAIVGLLFFIGITIGLFVLVAVMAQKRNRSVVVWVLLSLIATPLLMIIILLAIGKNENYIENHYDRE